MGKLKKFIIETNRSASKGKPTSSATFLHFLKHITFLLQLLFI